MITLTRNKYHTFIVYLYVNNKENILPISFRKNIPASTISTWRNNTEIHSYTGHEYSYIQDEAITREILLLENTNLKAIINALIKVWILLKEPFLQWNKTVQKNVVYRQMILDSIQLLATKFSLKTACHIFHLSTATYHSWLFQVKHKCIESLHSLCFKRHKNQLSVSETKTIKEYLSLPEFFHWPVASIAYYALRKKTSSVSVATWYKYARLLGIQRKIKPKKIKKTGLRATYPNQYWHIDNTQYTLENGEVTYITFVIDNFSRLILGYHISLRNSWENVKVCLQKAVNLSASVHFTQHINLVADGGHENHHPNVKAFLYGLKNVDIKVLRALKDITYSNSPVEAIHRTIKGFYLNRLSFHSIEKLNEYLNSFVLKDFNELRPHCSLKGLTPLEKYIQPQKVLSFSSQFSSARQIRIEENSIFNCNLCKTGS